MSSTARNRIARDQQLDAVFQALSDRTRRALLAQLAKGSAVITELAKPFDMSLPAVSRHIRVLENAGLVTRVVEGRTHHCSLNPNPLEGVEGWLIHYRQYWTSNLESLAEYVQSAGAKP
jgi:DNA-binding transcriptional ArsR family regulator